MVVYIEILQRFTLNSQYFHRLQDDKANVVPEPAMLLFLSVAITLVLLFCPSMPTSIFFRTISLPLLVHNLNFVSRLDGVQLFVHHKFSIFMYVHSLLNA